MATVKYRAPRGTSDIMGPKAAALHHMDALAEEVFGDFGYSRIITPTFEDTELFRRSIGESSDIVRKEMYTFEDRGGRSLTLRPEATAPVVRAFIEHNMQSLGLPVKLFYVGTMYRYERPQAGRYREFWQIGVEALGSPEPSIDAECITMLMDYLGRLGLGKLNLHIGSMGCNSCRGGYRQMLQGYLRDKREAMCVDCQLRMDANPLRVFDCKNESCARVLGEAPKITEHLCSDCAEHFAKVGQLLEDEGLSFKVDSTLVRGFDYYTRTTFEVRSFALGAQNALGGGGRYDDLVGQYGGQPTPAVGFAMGVERVLLAGALEEKLAALGRPDLFLASVSDAERDYTLRLANQLRGAGVAVAVDHMKRSLRAQMKLADKLAAKYVVVVGADEVESGRVTLRDMATKQEQPIAIGELHSKLSEAKGI